MKKLGAKTIYIYEQDGSRWLLVESYDEYDTGMSKSNSSKHSNTIYYNGIAGSEYRVVVTVFAKDKSDVQDTESETFYVTAKK